MNDEHSGRWPVSRAESLSVIPSPADYKVTVGDIRNTREYLLKLEQERDEARFNLSVAKQEIEALLIGNRAFTRQYNELHQENAELRKKLEEHEQK